MDMINEALGSKPGKSKKIVDKRKHGIARHVVHHHHDGTHHIEAHPIGGGEPIHQGAANDEQMHDQLEQNLNGTPSEGELQQVAQGAKPEMPGA